MSQSTRLCPALSQEVLRTAIRGCPSSVQIRPHMPETDQRVAWRSPQTGSAGTDPGRTRPTVPGIRQRRRSSAGASLDRLCHLHSRSASASTGGGGGAHLWVRQPCVEVGCIGPPWQARYAQIRSLLSRRPLTEPAAQGRESTPDGGDHRSRIAGSGRSAVASRRGSCAIGIEPPNSK
jgi:hypothetical protein